MTVSINTVVRVVVIGEGGLKSAHVVASVLVGFYLASSSLAPSITQLTYNVAETIAQLRL